MSSLFSRPHFVLAQNKRRFFSLAKASGMLDSLNRLSSTASIVTQDRIRDPAQCKDIVDGAKRDRLLWHAENNAARFVLRNSACATVVQLFHAACSVVAQARQIHGQPVLFASDDLQQQILAEVGYGVSHNAPKARERLAYRYHSQAQGAVAELLDQATDLRGGLDQGLGAEPRQAVQPQRRRSPALDGRRADARH